METPDLCAPDSGIRGHRAPRGGVAEYSRPIGRRIVRAFCFFGRETPVYFRLRPSLPDPGDEFLLELAVAGRADAIVTHNVKHLIGAERFGIQVVTPREFLRRIEEGEDE